VRLGAGERVVGAARAELDRGVEQVPGDRLAVEPGDRGQLVDAPAVAKEQQERALDATQRGPPEGVGRRVLEDPSARSGDVERDEDLLARALRGRRRGG
jgi:hypothetical protein